MGALEENELVQDRHNPMGMVEASIRWTRIERQFAFVLWNWCVLAGGSKMNSIFLLNCYYEIKAASPQGKRGNPQKTQLRTFGEDVVGMVGSFLGPVELLSHLVVHCLGFAVIFRLLCLPEAVRPTPVLFGIGCYSSACYWRNDCTILKHWELSGRLQNVLHLHSGFICLLHCPISPLEHF